MPYKVRQLLTTQYFWKASEKSNVTQKKDSDSFTFDSEVTGLNSIPTVTRLINRKSIKKTGGSSNKQASSVPTPPPPPGPALKAQEVELNLFSPAAPAADRQPKLVPAAQKSSSNAELADWSTPGIEVPEAAEVLQLESISPGVKSFRAKSARASSARKKQWAGLSWNTGVLPDLWNEVVSKGQVHVGPSSAGAGGNSYSSIRAALGVSSSEWITIHRVGSPNQVQGIVFVVYLKSIPTAAAA